MPSSHWFLAFTFRLIRRHGWSATIVMPSPSDLPYLLSINYEWDSEAWSTDWMKGFLLELLTQLKHIFYHMQCVIEWKKMFWTKTQLFWTPNSFYFYEITGGEIHGIISNYVFIEYCLWVYTRRSADKYKLHEAWAREIIETIQHKMWSSFKATRGK